MCGFIAQLVEHHTGITEVTGSNPVEALIFFQASFQLLKLEKKNLLRWSFFTLIYHRSSHMNYFIYTSHHFTPHGRYALNKLTSLPMCGFIAQLVEHRTGIAEVTGSNPVEALIFFRLLSNCLNWKKKFTAMIILHFDLPPQFTYELFHIYFTPFHSSREICTQQIDLAPNVWLHSSVGRASHWYRGGHRFESRWSPDFFQASFQLLKLKKMYCDDHSSL